MISQEAAQQSPSSDFNGCPRKNDPWARVGSMQGLRGASIRGSMPFLPACETLGVEIAFLEGSRLWVPGRSLVTPYLITQLSRNSWPRLGQALALSPHHGPASGLIPCWRPQAWQSGNTEERPVSEHQIRATQSQKLHTGLLQDPLGNSASPLNQAKGKPKLKDGRWTLAGVWEAKMEARSDGRNWARMNWREEPLLRG